MASSLHSNNPTLFFSTSPRSRRNLIPNHYFPSAIRCGPRDNRGALQKGRVLSTEAIQAIQALKRSQHDSTKINQIASKTLTRLIKKDLLAALNELLRQNQCRLALAVFAVVRSEVWYKTDCGLYAAVVSALARNGMAAEIDGVVAELVREEEGWLVREGDCGGGVARLVRALVAAERGEAVVRVYEAMKRRGWGRRFSVENEEYVVKVLSRGLRRLGVQGVADEVDREFSSLFEGIVGKSSV